VVSQSTHSIHFQAGWKGEKPVSMMPKKIAIPILAGKAEGRIHVLNIPGAQF
jgi:hypothetical protein